MKKFMHKKYKSDLGFEWFGSGRLNGILLVFGSVKSDGFGGSRKNGFALTAFIVFIFLGRVIALNASERGSENNSNSPDRFFKSVFASAHVSGGADLTDGLRKLSDRFEGLILVDESENDDRVSRIVQDEVRPFFDRYLPSESDYVVNATGSDNLDDKGAGFNGHYKIKFQFDESQMQMALDVLARIADLDESFVAADYALVLRECQPDLFVSLFLKMPFEQRLSLEMQMDIAQDSDH